MDYKLEKLKILVTGASGLIGSQLTKNLCEKYQVFSGYHSKKPLFGKPIHFDLSKLDEISTILQTISPDAIIHLAALTDVDGSESNEENTLKINSKSTEELAKYAGLKNIFILYVSTDYIFDGKEGLKKETDTPNPLGVYGRSKLEGEKAIMNFASKWCIARTSTPFGVSKLKKTFPLFVYENLKNNTAINAVSDQFTSPTYVPNLCDMLEEILIKQIEGIIHTAGTRISRFDISKKIAEKINANTSLVNPISMDELDWIAKRPKDSSLDITKATTILDSKPISIDESLELFLEELQNHS